MRGDRPGETTATEIPTVDIERFWRPLVAHWLADTRAAKGSVELIALAGPVAVGKSTAAALLARLISEQGRAEVAVGLDGFLFSNAELADRELAKGTPESYDWDAITAWVQACRAGTAPPAPTYSHEFYDVDPTAQQSTTGADVVIVEGIYGVHPVLGAAGVTHGLYLDADHRDLARWYQRRFVHLVERAQRAAASGTDPGFYGSFVGLDHRQRRDVAAAIWTTYNLPLIVNHIEPTRPYATRVITLDRNQHPH